MDEDFQNKLETRVAGLLADTRRRLGIPDDETQEAFDGERRAAIARIKSTRTKYQDLTERDRWYLPEGFVGELYVESQRPCVSDFNVPLSFQGARAVDGGRPEETDAIKRVNAWLTHFREPVRRYPLLVLLGGVGIGKSVAAAWALRQTGHGIYYRASDIIRLATANFGDERVDWEHALRGEMLVVDEVGAELHPQRLRAAMLEIIDRRQRSKTIIISNLDREGFMRRLDARSVDRLRQVGAIRELSGESMRGKGKG